MDKEVGRVSRSREEVRKVATGGLGILGVESILEDECLQLDRQLGKQMESLQGLV